ncbi:glycosyltransferase family 4 protein [Clostridium sp. CM027]|uniref:glycosyltransferase family 4 protein n=1 Tax=Clostridium sp. CM027 TaxID=2849865 RepID=UPI001C6EBB1F|nr:glycosyltransferase family 4 protein [Clostridium sp. CM027]MBW9145244.1 glycosyltransferase family 4 protein [Clostridium sp. CM027]UVE40377.1 glycosyltransferase family 4 protein [Clostridium sp. CM027]
MKKILFISTEGFDTPGPSNHLVSSLIEDLLDSGFSIHLIQSRRKKINSEIPDTLKNKRNLEMTVINRKIINKNSFIHRYFEEALYAFKCFKIWIKMKDIDSVFVQSCPTVVFSIVLLKLFMRKPILYSVQDMFPGSAVSSGVINNRFIKWVFYKIQKVAYKNSDILTVISEDMKMKVVEQGVPPKKIFSIVNWFDDRTVHEVQWEDNRFVKKYNLQKNKFYVQYAGTMGYVFDYKMVLNVAELLKGYKDIEFQMIGQGSKRAAFIGEKEKRGLDNIVFYPLEPQDMVSDVYSTCSICLIPLKKGIIGNSVPSKAGLLMACSRTIVNSVDDDSDYYKMFNENEMGISAPNDDPKAVADAIFDLYKNKEKRESLAKIGHEFGKKYYGRNTNTLKFIELFSGKITEKF